MGGGGVGVGDFKIYYVGKTDYIGRGSLPLLATSGKTYSDILPPLLIMLGIYAPQRCSVLFCIVQPVLLIRIWMYVSAPFGRIRIHPLVVCEENNKMKYYKY